MYLEYLISQARSPDERITLYSTLLKMQPNNGDYWYRLGKLYLGMNMQQEGIESLEKAYSLNVKEEDLYCYRGWSITTQFYRRYYEYLSGF